MCPLGALFGLSWALLGLPWALLRLSRGFRWPQKAPQMVQDGPRWLQDGPRWPQDGPLWAVLGSPGLSWGFLGAPDGFKMVPRWSKTAQGTAELHRTWVQHTPLFLIWTRPGKRTVLRPRKNALRIANRNILLRPCCTLALTCCVEYFNSFVKLKSGSKNKKISIDVGHEKVDTRHSALRKTPRVDFAHEE